MTPWLLAALVAAPTIAADVPKEKDGRWVEMKSPTFSLVTDAGEEAGRRTIARFEKIRTAFAAAIPSARHAEEGELLIVAVRDEESLRSLVPGYWEEKRGVRPASVHLVGLDRVFILVRTDLREDDDESFRAAHWGYASHLTQLNAPGAPLWVDRGLADFYARTTVERSRVLVGRTAPLHVRILRERGLVPMRTFYEVDRHSPEYLDRDELRRFDAQSWALAHYLMLGDEGAHRDRLGRFLLLLGEGKEREAAASRAFGDPDALEQALNAYVQGQAFSMHPIDTEVAQDLEETTVRPLTAAESLTLRGSVHLAGEALPQARACLDEALRIEPGLAWAHEVRASVAWAEGDPVAARETIARALEIEPDRPRARRLQERFAGPPTLKGAERLCHAGDSSECVRLGSAIIDGGSGLPPDPERGVALLQRVCNGGEAEACRQLSWRFRQGAGVPADPSRARELLELGCAAGDGLSCLSAAAEHRSAGEGSGGGAAAAGLLESACTHGETEGCLTLAFVLQTGEGVPQDLDRAAALYHDGCQSGSGASCTRLGLMYARPGGLTMDLARARALLEKGCALGDDLGCSTLESLKLAAALDTSSP